MGIRRQETEDRRRKTEDGRQKTEDRRRRAEDRGRKGGLGDDWGLRGQWDRRENAKNAPGTFNCAFLFSL